MAESHTLKTNRRIRFSLRTCFALFTLAALVFAALGREYNRHTEAASAEREIVKLGGTVHWNSEVYETIFRDMALTRITDVHIDNSRFPDEGLLKLRELPQRFGLQVSGAQFSDASLNYLRQIPNLEYLVVTNTAVTDKGLSKLKLKMPQLSIMHGYPGDPGYREVE